MAWCPKCKSEYEEGVKLCADCKIELVDNLDDVVGWQVIVNARKEEDAIDVIEYLRYSGIEKVKYEIARNEDEESYFAIAVSTKEAERAMKYLKGYMVNKANENQENVEDDEEEITNEYETENYKDDTIVKDLKSSVYTFGLVGIVLLVVSILVFLDIVIVSFSNKYLFSGLMFAISVTFIIIASNSAKRINKEKQNISNRDSQIDSIIQWFGDNYNLEYIKERYDIDFEGLDEGAIYYMVVDKLQEDISKQFVHVDMKIVNSAAELIYEKIVN